MSITAFESNWGNPGDLARSAVSHRRAWGNTILIGRAGAVRLGKMKRMDNCGGCTAAVVSAGGLDGWSGEVVTTPDYAGGRITCPLIPSAAWGHGRRWVGVVDGRGLVYARTAGRLIHRMLRMMEGSR